MLRAIDNIIRFNHEIRPRLLQFCQPLFRDLKFNAFGYTKIFRDGRRFVFESNEMWLQKYSTNDFRESFGSKVSLYENMAKTDTEAYHSLVLSGQPKTNVHQILYDLNLWNSMSFYARNQDSIEAFHFSTSRKNTEIMNLYVNHNNLMRRFALFFKEKIDDLLGEKYPTAKVVNESELNSIFYGMNQNRYDISRLIQDTDIKKIYLPSHGVYLPKKEVACLHYLCQGKTNKQIAIKLSVSPRTIEQYISNLKHRLGITFKSELVDIGEINSVSSINLD